MPPDSSPRSEETIKSEYMRECAKAGQFQYQIELLKANLEATNQIIHKLNQEQVEIDKAKAAPKEESNVAPQA